jgi:excisionase family DNA binding protein
MPRTRLAEPRRSGTGKPVARTRKRRPPPPRTEPDLAGARVWLTTDQVCARYRLAPTTLVRLRKAGTVTAYTFGPRLVRFPLDELEAVFTPIPATGMRRGQK